MEVGTETVHVDANAAEEPERTNLYNKMVEMLPGFDDYRPTPDAGSYANLDLGGIAASVRDARALKLCEVY